MFDLIFFYYLQDGSTHLTELSGASLPGYGTPTGSTGSTNGSTSGAENPVDLSSPRPAPTHAEHAAAAAAAAAQSKSF